MRYQIRDAGDLKVFDLYDWKADKVVKIGTWEQIKKASQEMNIADMEKTEAAQRAKVARKYEWKFWWWRHGPDIKDAAAIIAFVLFIVFFDKIIRYEAAFLSLTAFIVVCVCAYNQGRNEKKHARWVKQMAELEEIKESARNIK